MKASRYKTYLAFTIAIILGSVGIVIAVGWKPQQGLDLSGGVSVILTATGEGATESDVIDQTVEIIRQRVDAIGAAEADVTRAGTNNILVQMPGVKNEEQAIQLIGSTAQLTFRQVEKVYQTSDKKAPEVTEDKGAGVTDETVVYPSGEEGSANILYELKPAVLTGDVVEKAEAVPDSQVGATWSVSITMDDEGSAVWADFTGRLACLRDKGEQEQSQVAIVLDGRVESAAGMQSPGEAGASDPGVECNKGIAGGQTQINVGDQGEAKNLALVLRTGALPVTLEQSQVQKVSPTLGQDSLNAGLLAGAIGIALVFVYMILYYRALGFVVWAGLILFTGAIYAVLSILGETSGLALSLAGVAGIIVSIGITADSYIVAFERLKDETRGGKSVRAAAERGMVRAFRTILVADFVTGAAAVILFFLAIGPVKGFALTLGIATVIDVLIAYFFTRPAVNLLVRSERFTGARFIGVKDALGVKS
jgi:protein-export membrane protein SecD